MANIELHPENLKPVQTKEEARTRGANGGKKSGEVRRAKRDARKAARYILQLAAQGTQLANVEGMGASAEDGITNMEVLQARLFAMAMSGDIKAYETLIKVAGYWAEENRAERESIASEKRKNAELEAKLKALGSNPEGASLALNMGSEDGSSDVVIYIPKMLSEKECEVPDEEEPAQEGAEEKEPDTPK